MTTTIGSLLYESIPAECDAVPGDCPLPPPGYAIATLPDGCFLPMSVLLLSREDAIEVSLSLCGLHWQDEIIPPAGGDWPRTGSIICRTYAEAYSFCEQCAETSRLFLESERLAVVAECYPDRNVWYRDEIERLLHEADYCWPGRNDGPFSIISMTGSISAWIHARSLTSAEMHLHIQAANLDEMWEALYAVVFATSGTACDELPANQG